MKPQALLKKVICEAIKGDDVTAGGIVIPTCHTKDQVKMKVVSKGMDVTKEVKIGDVLIISGFQGHELIVGEDKYKIFEQDQILAVVE